MAFEPKVVEAKLALGMIVTTDMPRMAWDALEAGYDGPGIRRLAALDFPTYFQVREVLPRVMEELGIAELTAGEAAHRLAKLRAQQILSSTGDPRRHLEDFWVLWVKAKYCRELAQVGSMADDVDVAYYSGESDAQTRAWVLERLRAMADS
jgi:hypothetical protein